MGNKAFLTKTLKDEETRKTIVTWQDELQENRGDRAKLRRCREPSQVIVQSAYHHLKASLPDWPPSQSMALAAIAGLISNVETHSGSISFGRQLGMPKAEGGASLMSETRFRQLIKSRDWLEFYRRMRRAIRMVKSGTNILSIADYTLQFGFDLRKLFQEPSKSFQFRFAEDYFEYILKPDKGNSKKEAS